MKAIIISESAHSGLTTIKRTVPLAAQPVRNALSVEVVSALLKFAYFQIPPILLKEGTSIQPWEAYRTLLVDKRLRNALLIYRFQSALNIGFP